MELVNLTAKDFCCFEEFEITFQKQGLVWVTGENHDSEAASNNGCGKSTIFKALTWGLYGQTIDKEKGDKVIRQGCKKAQVDVKLFDGKVHWKVTRTRKKDSPDVALTNLETGDKYDATKEEIQDRIIDMVGLDFLSFRNTVLYGQNDLIRFAHPRTKDSDRKEMLHRILRTGILADCYQEILNERKETKKLLAEFEKKEESLIARREDADNYIEEVKADSDLFESNKTNAIEDFELEIEELKGDAEKLFEESKEEDEDELIFDFEGAEKELEKLKSFVVKEKKIREDIEELRGKNEERHARHNKASSEAVEFFSQAKSLEERLEDLEGDKCPICESSLTTGTPAKLKKELEQKRKKANAQGASKKQEAEGYLDTINSNKHKIYKLKEKLDEIGQKKIKLRELEDQIVEQRDLEEENEERREKLRQEARSKIEEAKRVRAKLREKKKEANPYKITLEVLAKKRKDFSLEIKRAKKNIEEMASELSIIEFWVRGFSNQGLPSFILDSIMPFLSTQANKYLEILSDGDIKMEFATQRELKSKKDVVRDEIDITWEIEGVQNFPPSGGQLKKMEIATDFALMDLVATREGSHIDLLALDEVLDGLDLEGRQRVLSLLQEMRKSRGSIFVISHETDVAEIFEKSIMVEKSGGISRIVEE